MASLRYCARVCIRFTGMDEYSERVSVLVVVGSTLSIVCGGRILILSCATLGGGAGIVLFLTYVGFIGIFF